jgi:putative membrane protein
MIRHVAVAVVALLANAIALIVVAWLLDGMTLEVQGLLIEVAIFTGVMILVEALVRRLSPLQGHVFLSGSALLATVIALVVTTLVTDGLQLSGASTWFLAIVLMWGFPVIVRLLLPYVIFKETLRRREPGR